MTDLINALIVVVDKDICMDDIEPLMDAIKMMKNVIDVKANVSDLDSIIAERRAQHVLSEKLWEVLKS